MTSPQLAKHEFKWHAPADYNDPFQIFFSYFLWIISILGLLLSIFVVFLYEYYPEYVSESTKQMHPYMVVMFGGLFLAKLMMAAYYPQIHTLKGDTKK